MKNKESKLKETLSLAVQTYKNKNIHESINLFNKVVEIEPSIGEAYHYLGNAFKYLGEYKKAVTYFKKAIKVKPNLAASYNSLGIILQDQGKNLEALEQLEMAIKIKPNLVAAHNNLGILYMSMNKDEEAISCFKKIIKINPQFSPSNYNLGKIYKKLKKFDEAIKYFKKANNVRSRAELIETIYFSKGLKDFKKKLKEVLLTDALNLRIAAISSYVFAIENDENIYPFCKKPLEYLFIKNIKKKLVSSESFTKNLYRDLRNIELAWEPKNKTTKNGYHTSGNLFDIKKDGLVSLEKIIYREIELFKNNYKNKSDYFIKKWPKKIKIESWHVRLLKQGYQNFHIHPAGWLSGCFYLKIPKKLTGNEGAIKFALYGYDYPVKKKLPSIIYTPKEFDLVLFPSSLFHGTIPFNSDEERHVIAFDIVPV